MATDSPVKSYRSKASYWRQHIEGWSGSGLSQSEYCRRSGIALSTFQYWKRRLDRRPPAQEERSIVAVPILSSSATVSSVPKPLMLHVGAGFRIEIGGDFCPATLEKLIVVLERWP